MFLLSPAIFPWDLAILLMLATGLSVAVVARIWLRHHRSAPRWKKICVGCFGSVGLVGFLLVAYGSFIEPKIFVTTRYTVDLPLKSSLKIAAVADLHVGPYKGAADVARVVERINRELPDLVFLLGDFLYDASSDPEMLAPLKDIRASIGTFAVMGNHDSGFYLSLFGSPTTLPDQRIVVRRVLGEAGVTILEDASDRIFINGTEEVTIAGVEDLWAGEADIGSTLAAASAVAATGSTTILLAHNPDVILAKSSHAAHLILAGHTHGGQIRLPFLGPVPPLPVRLGRAYDQGLFAVDDDTTLAITRGAGETLARARLFAWPEVMVIETK